MSPTFIRGKLVGVQSRLDKVAIGKLSFRRSNPDSAVSIKVTILTELPEKVRKKRNLLILLTGEEKCCFREKIWVLQ